MHPPLTLHRHPMCADLRASHSHLGYLITAVAAAHPPGTMIIEEFQKCHLDHPVKKFLGECTDLKIKLDRCFRQEKAVKRKANFEESKKRRERLQEFRKEMAEGSVEQKSFA